MKQVIQAIFLFIISSLSCTQMQKVSGQQSEQFSKEIKELQQYFHIPGMAAIVIEDGEIITEEYLGLADVEKDIAMDAETAIPMASLTKIFSASLIHQLAEEGKLSLDDPINMYLDEHPFSEDISIAHVLSHTSQGNPGEQFYYSYRFGALTAVIEKASGKSYEDVFQERILNHLRMENSIPHLSEAYVKEKKLKVAKPYAWEGEIQAGRFEYGFSSSAGLLSTLRDMARFDKALNENSLISAHAKSELFRPLSPHLPYAKGIFKSKMLDEEIYWGYGQYDHFSSLYIKLPKRKLSLIMAANNNLMSDPARLIYGDLSYSLFAQSFLKNFVLDKGEMNLLEDASSLEKLSMEKSSDFYRDKLLAQAVAESFLARYEVEHFQRSVDILSKVFDMYPEVESYADLTLLHNLSFLKTLDFHLELGGFDKFDEQLEKIGKMILHKDKANPYANVYMGGYFDMKGEVEKARTHYKSILEADNFSSFWYTNEAKNWLEAHP
ncbi:MAG: serine hydrolase domain-containing protein [Bacteroidia bacterium]|nr:serine hydrolase domain-containing protein [Bacteroidia bacterium]